MSIKWKGMLNIAVGVLIVASVLSGFIINIYYGVVLKDIGYVKKAFVSLGESFIIPQQTIKDSVNILNSGIVPQHMESAYMILILSSTAITFGFLLVIFKIVDYLVGHFIHGVKSPGIIVFLFTVLVFFFFTNIATFTLRGELVWNPFFGWSELVLKNPQIVSEFVSEKIEPKDFLKEGGVCPPFNCESISETMCRCLVEKTNI